MRRKQIIALMFGFGIALSPYIAFGTTGSVTIDFGGLCNPITIAQPPPFFLFPAGGSITCASGGTNYFRIEDNGANRARILPSSDASADSDPNNDTLRVVDWRITALTATPANRPQGYEVSVWLQFNSLPNTDGSGGTMPDIYYKTISYGNLTRTTGNWITMAPGYVTNPLGSAETTLGIAKTYNATCAGAGPCSFGLSTSGKWPDNPNVLNGARILRTKFSFRLNAPNDVLLLSNIGQKLNSQTNADPNQDECSEQYTDCPSCWYKIFSSTRWTVARFGKVETSETAKLDTFTRLNWASLQQDMARGSGEHLTSLATLLEVPIEKQKDFFVFAQDQYRVQAEEGVVKRVELLSRLQEAIADRPMLFAGTMEPNP